MLCLQYPLFYVPSINKFDGSFDEGCQNTSVPAELLTFMSILIVGPQVDNTYYSQPALTVSQLILSNFKQKSQNPPHKTYRCNHKNYETPVQIYTGLKICGTVTSKTLIAQMYHLGICISNPRVLEMTKSLSDDLTDQWKQDGVFCPSKLRKFIFTVIAKDNCDLNATPSTASQHYHGKSMSVIQFPSDKEKGEEIPKLSH